MNNNDNEKESKNFAEGQEYAEETENAEDSPKAPKPLKKLVRVNKSTPKQEYHGEHEAPEYHGEHEAPEYHGEHEAPEYHGEHEAPEYHGEHETPEYHGEHESVRKIEADRKKSYKDLLTKIISIAASFVLIMVLVLTMPILRYEKKGQPDERVSIITFFRRWQPLVGLEGEINKQDVQPNIDENKVPQDFNDGLDLPQIVEGQYSVLFLGFEPDQYNTDIIWVVQFDIAGGKMNILQIPRDTCLPDYTSAASGKFNSIYNFGREDLTPIQRVVNAVQENFGIPIDAYVTTTCDDIVDIIDTIGGVPMHIDNEIDFEPHAPGTKVIPAGNVVLSGEQSVWFMRFRSGWLEGDIGRVKNQRRFMAAAMQKLMSIVNDEGKVKLYSYLKKIYDNKWIATDMSVEDISKLADFASTLSMDNASVHMVPGEGTPNDDLYVGTDGNRYSIYSVHKQETIDLLNEYFRPYQKPMLLADSAIVEYYTVHNYDIYDDNGATLGEMEDATEPPRA